MTGYNEVEISTVFVTKNSGLSSIHHLLYLQFLFFISQLLGSSNATCVYLSYSGTGPSEFRKRLWVRTCHALGTAGSTVCLVRTPNKTVLQLRLSTVNPCISVTDKWNSRSFSRHESAAGSKCPPNCCRFQSVSHSTPSDTTQKRCLHNDMG